MKNPILLFLSFAISCSAFSQINKGQFLLGGAVNFDSEKEEYPGSLNYKSNNFSISPAVGYFMFTGLAGGVKFTYTSNNSKSDASDVKGNTAAIAPFLRTYILPASKKVNAFIDLSRLWSTFKWHNSGNTITQKTRGFQVSAGPSIFLTEQVALEFTLGFKHTSTDHGGPSNSDSFNSGFGLQIHLGKSKKAKTGSK